MPLPRIPYAHIVHPNLTMDIMFSSLIMIETSNNSAQYNNQFNTSIMPSALVGIGGSYGEILNVGVIVSWID